MGIAVAGIVAFAGSMGCGGNGSCPAQAVVTGINYGLSGPKDLPGLEGHLAAAADATNTAVAPYLSGMTLYTVANVDRSLILVGRALPNESRGAYVVLFSIQHSELAWARLCAFVSGGEAGAASECTPPRLTPSAVPSSVIGP